MFFWRLTVEVVFIRLPASEAVRQRFIEALLSHLVLRVLGLGFGVWGEGLGLRFRVYDLGFGV